MCITCQRTHVAHVNYAKLMFAVGITATLNVARDILARMCQPMCRHQKACRILWRDTVWSIPCKGRPHARWWFCRCRVINVVDRTRLAMVLGLGALVCTVLVSQNIRKGLGLQWAVWPKRLLMISSSVCDYAEGMMLKLCKALLVLKQILNFAVYSFHLFNYSKTCTIIGD